MGRHQDLTTLTDANAALRVDVAGRSVALADLWQLTKPSITLMSVITAVGAMGIAWVGGLVVVGLADAGLALAGIAASVMGASALNMWIERDLDAEMARTRDRPLPAARLDPTVGLAVGLVLSAVSWPLVWVAGGGLPLGLTVAAQVLYVMVYTPMKTRSSWAVVVGAAPGAMPILMGYAAVTGTVDAVSLVLFGILFVWQLPHFMAISLYRQKEYTKAGYVVASEVLGPDRTRTLVVATALPTVGLSLMLVPYGVAGAIYGLTAALSGLWFVALCVRGFTTEAPAVWGRRVFLGTLVWQMALFAALALDVTIRSQQI